MGENQYIYTINYVNELCSILVISLSKYPFHNYLFLIFLFILVFYTTNLIKIFIPSIIWDNYIIFLLNNLNLNTQKLLLKLIKNNKYSIPLELIPRFYFKILIDKLIKLLHNFKLNLYNELTSFNIKNIVNSNKINIKNFKPTNNNKYYLNSTDKIFKIINLNFLIIYNFFKSTIIAIICVLLYVLFGFFFFQVQFIKQLAIWFVVGMLFFWLISGFNFFIKRYQFAKFTSQIQRFWKRTNIYFWLIEGFLILIYFYYFLNSSQEPIYMYDYSSLNQEYLIPLNIVFLNIILLSLIIYFMYYVLLSLNYTHWNQSIIFIILISIFLFMTFFLETYQFYYVINSFNERIWVFNDEENLWQIITDSPIFRVKQQYLLVCLIAKYWHFLFIFISWIFFTVKSFEKKKITYVLFGVNLQNIIILYALNFLCYLQWFKWIYRRFFDIPYTWFFINNDNRLCYKFIFELKLLFINFLNINESLSFNFHTKYISLLLWNNDLLYFWKMI